jgi:phage terminase small subunit
MAEYLKDFNGTQAAIRAGYSKRSAAAIAFEMLRKPEIQVAINKRLAKLAMSADEVLIELARIGRADVKEMFGEDGKMLHPKDMPESIRRAISGIDVKAGTIKVRFWSKTEALNLAGKHHKLFGDRPEAPPSGVYVNVLVSDQDAARIVASLVGRAQLSNGNSGNGNGNADH